MSSRLLLAALLTAASITSPGPVRAVPNGGDMTAQAAAAYFDTSLGGAVARGEAVHAAVALVQDGRVVFSAGYGHADSAGEGPVTPDTVFRVTSITKLLTAAAVMKMVEAGRLDLDRDASQYLDFPLRREFRDVVSLRRLMTHTAGFEERSKDFSAPPASIRLADYVRQARPKQIYRPGTTVAYSNYGLALAGRIVERAAGVPFAALVEREILRPLGMTRSTLAQPHPQPLLAGMATERRSPAGAPEGVIYLPDTPAGGLVSTAADMARFMIDQLEGGRVLSRHSLDVMQARQFSPHPFVDGVGFVYREDTASGRRAIYQGGDSCCTHADLYLVPDARIGLFLVVGGAGRKLQRDVWRGFVERRFAPGSPPPAIPAPDHLVQAERAAGRYALSRRSESSITSLLYPFAVQHDVVPRPDGRIVMPTVFRKPDGRPAEFVAVGPNRFREVDGFRRIAILTRGARVVGMAGGGLIQADRVPLHQDGRLLGAALGASLLVLLLGLLSWPATALWWRGHGRAVPPDPQRKRLNRVRLFAVSALLFAGGYVAFFLAAQADNALLSSTKDWVLRVLQLLAVLAVGGAVYAVFAALLPRQRHGWTWLAIALHAAALAIVAAAVVAYNVLEPTLRY